VELDEALRDVTSQLDVAEQARRALAEELQRVKDEHAATMTTLGKAIAMGFNPNVAAGAMRDREGLQPDRNLTADIVSVQRSSTETLAEINAGQKDGVKKDWLLTIGDANGNYVANLKIIKVDVNRATGIVLYEDAKSRGTVKERMKVYASAGR